MATTPEERARRKAIARAMPDPPESPRDTLARVLKAKAAQRERERIIEAALVSAYVDGFAAGFAWAHRDRELN